jgi:hypothetical protein
MQFDYFSLTEENKKKWLQCIVIAICTYIIFQYELYAKLAKYTADNYGVSFAIYTFIASRIVLSTI